MDGAGANGLRLNIDSPYVNNVLARPERLIDRVPETPIEKQRFTDADRQTIRNAFRQAIRADLEMRELDLKMGKI